MANEKSRPDKKKVAKKNKNKTGIPVAFNQFKKASNNLLGLHPILWPFILLVSYQIIRDALEKNRQERDLEDAHRFLYESRGFH